VEIRAVVVVRGRPYTIFVGEEGVVESDCAELFGWGLGWRHRMVGREEAKPGIDGGPCCMGLGCWRARRLLLALARRIWQLEVDGLWEEPRFVSDRNKSCS
jgi:hypothetical protein